MQEETVQPQKKDAEKTGEKALEELLAEAQAKIEQQRDSMMRAVADAENARKRAQAEAASARKYALEQFAEGLLPVMDSLEAALKTGDTSGVEVGEDPTLPAGISNAVHEYLLVEQGVHIGEFHNLEELARDRVHEFCYVCMTNRIRGTVAGFALRPIAIR